MVLVRQSLRIYCDIVMAPQSQSPSHPIAQDLLMTTETQDGDFILSQAPKTNMHEVPSYYGSRAKSALSFIVRIYKIDTNATSVSSGSGSVISWTLLGHHSDGSTATRPFGDEHARSAVLLRFPCEQKHARQRLTHQPSANLSEYIAKQASCLPDSYSLQEPNVRTFGGSMQG